MIVEAAKVGGVQQYKAIGQAVQTDTALDPIRKRPEFVKAFGPKPTAPLSTPTGPVAPTVKPVAPAGKPGAEKVSPKTAPGTSVPEKTSPGAIKPETKKQSPKVSPLKKTSK